MSRIIIAILLLSFVSIVSSEEIKRYDLIYAKCSYGWKKIGDNKFSVSGKINFDCNINYNEYDFFEDCRNSSELIHFSFLDNLNLLFGVFRGQHDGMLACILLTDKTIQCVPQFNYWSEYKYVWVVSFKGTFYTTCNMETEGGGSLLVLPCPSISRYTIYLSGIPKGPGDQILLEC